MGSPHTYLFTGPARHSTHALTHSTHSLASPPRRPAQVGCLLVYTQMHVHKMLDGAAF